MHKVNIAKINAFTGHRDCVYTLQPSDKTNLFFSGAGDGMVVRWDMQNPEEGVLIAKLPNSIYALHYHAPSNQLLAGHNYDGIHLLDWENKRELASLHLTRAAIFDIQSHGNSVFAACGDGSLVCVDIEKLVVTAKNKHSEKKTRTIAVHPQRGELAVGYSDHYIRIFDLQSLALKHEWQAHLNSVFTLRYSPDGTLLFSGSRDARLKAWDVQAGYLQAVEVVAHMYAINHIEFSPDAKHFVTCSMDKSIKVWDTDKLQLLKVIDKARYAGHGTSVNKLLWTSFESRLLSASDDRSISAWQIFSTTDS
ncbi:MAG TPA: WD40 repeat domain-containing protein [Cyclobacteriaceae bacterium]|nr:WD40 repeat domain-containing protein [Cyclobacteriaceae bacterium]